MVDQTTSDSTSITLSRSWKSNLSNEDINTFLESQNLSYLSSAWPTLIYLSVLMAAGVAGNSLVLLVYSRKVKSGVTRFYILAMAVCDLATNCFSLPIEVLNIRLQYTFSSDWGCKVAWTFICFLVLLTSFLLLTVAVDRQRIICRQLQHACLPSSREHKAVALCVAFSLLLSSPMFWLLATQKVLFPDTNVRGLRCSYVDDPTFLTAYFVIQNLTFVTGLAGMCISYGRIARHLWVHKKRKRSTSVVFKRGSPNQNDAIQIEIQGDTPGDGAAQTTTTVASTTCTDAGSSEDADPSSAANTQASHTPGAADQTAPRRDASNVAEETNPNVEEDKNVASSWKLARLCCRLAAGKAGRQKIDVAHFSTAQRSRCRVRKIPTHTTLMLFLLTVVFCVNYIPYLLVMMMEAILSPQAIIDLLGFTVYHLILNSMYINSIINRIVYSFCSPQFRSNCRRLLGCRKA